MPQLQDDAMWAKWIDLAFNKLDENGDGFISVDEIVKQMPYDYHDESERLVALSKVQSRPSSASPLATSTSRAFLPTLRTTVAHCPKSLLKAGTHRH